MDGAEVVRFTTTEPAGFRELLAGDALPAVPMTGFLHLPSATGPVPLVIASIGSAGLASGREALYAAAFTAAGLGLFVVDSFGTRGFSETRTDQGRISFATSCADALYALAHMRNDPRIDPERIALLGYSRGGCAVLLSDDERLAQAVLGGGRRFAAYVALYPSVWLRWLHPRPAPGPVLVVMGEIDDMAPRARVETQAARLVAAGAAVETIVLPGAGHAFDAVQRAARHGDEINRCACDIAVDDDGSMCETATGLRLERDWPDFLQRVTAACGTIGGTTGHGPLARDAAVAPIVRFLRQTFARPKPAQATR